MQRDRLRAAGARAALGAALGLASGLLFRDLGLQSVFSIHGSRVVLVMIAAAAGALIGMTRLRVVLSVALALLVGLWIAVATTPLTRVLVAACVRRDPPATGDAVFVLASGVQDDGDLNSQALARFIHALEALHAGAAPRLIVSDVADRPSHAATIGRYLETLGVHVELTAVGAAGNTRDEAVLAARLFAKNGWTRVVVVTSPIHSRRAAETFERQGLEVVSSPCRETEYDIEGLDSSDDRIGAFGPALHELVGRFVYRWRGWI